MIKKNLVSAAVVALMLSGCSSTPETYSESTGVTNIEPVTMETMFANDAAIYTEQDITEERDAILTESNGRYSADTFLYELESSGVDMSVIETGTINFEFDSAKLSTDAKALIQRHVKLLKESEQLKVILEGHTDSTGDRSYNLKLGERRALTVKDYAIAQGALPHQIEVISYGEEKLITHELNDKELRLNRRAEFVYK
ncbi:OmpA family protein [Vibrio coralliirubri]|uniref:OmpA family protein n=1 Tax=Vibrio coralliirubri TaxID=1516159 RepID=UPI0022832E30|nr:OmpA family protein [Vibrio coralliirubri]MCY9861041.1 OmpA family protein [Vibrio coralliirubri]